MEAKPVQRFDQPTYPTRRDVLAGAASFALFSLTGCSFVFAETEGGKVTVAPIFEHGEGRGATGCMVLLPPVFLSEEEGMQILREELAKHGIKLKAGDTVEGIRLPSRLLDDEVVTKSDGKKEYKEKIVEVPNSTVPLKLDGIDSDKKVAVEFVSMTDYFDLGGPSSASTVQGYDFKDVAKFVAEQVKKQGKDRVFFGVFYDPLSEMPATKPSKDDEKINYDIDRKKRGKQSKEESERQLRLQAQDFVAWLKEQKAIQ